MAEDKTDNKLAAEVERQLDHLLNNWAEDVILSYLEANQENAAYKDVLIIAEDLGYSWWHGLFRRLSFNDIRAYPCWPVKKVV